MKHTSPHPATAIEISFASVTISRKRMARLIRTFNRWFSGINALLLHE